ncbi:diguanylate cyclase [Vibrio sp. CAIM 722]|uniref:Diguanylate cyclase n=1 Tax=Vibrio eleionomae TaxID=2653505 RepID=A0A7X4RSS3_9VIBR|nr:diguanylate cyclase [Vibrio eleionomae]MZI91986.1 diguanylate cyclase [Vibrio eleionomae]
MTKRIKRHKEANSAMPTKEDTRDSLPNLAPLLLAEIVNQCSSGISVCDVNGKIIYGNQQFKTRYNLSPESYVQQFFINTFNDISIDDILDRVDTETSLHLVETKSSDQSDWIILRVSKIVYNDEIMLLFLVESLTSTIINHLRVNIKLETIVDHLPVLIAHVDQQDRYLFANRTYETFFNCPLENVIGNSVENLIGSDAYAERKTYIQRVKQGHSVIFDHTFFVDDDIRQLQLKLVPGESGQEDYYIFAQDVTELRSFQKKLEFQAYHDSLTGLTNRTFFIKSLNGILSRNQQNTGLLFIDLDGLKIANDNYGHDSGDELLKRFADILKHTLRPQDIVSRLAGDEFTILIANLSNPTHDLEEVCQRIQGALPATMNIEGFDEERWLAIADSAMYKVKRHGKGGYNIEPTWDIADLNESFQQESIE